MPLQERNVVTLKLSEGRHITIDAPSDLTQAELEELRRVVLAQLIKRGKA